MITLSNNTLLKLQVRQGTEADRKQIILSTGELGFTLDYQRLYVGDGVTLGGHVVGNKFLGSTADITSLAGVPGDIAYQTSDQTLNTIVENYGTQASDWSQIARTYNPDQTTLITNGNTISVGKISGSNIDSQALDNGLEISNTSKLQLKQSIPINEITVRSGNSLTIPRSLNFENITLTFPNGGVFEGGFMYTDALGNLNFANPFATNNTYYNAGSGIPVGTVMVHSVSSGLPSGWLLCNGQTVAVSANAEFQDLYNVIGTTYGGTGPNDFKVPDLRGRVAVGSGSTTINTVLCTFGLSEVGGEFKHSLAEGELPSHKHDLTTGGIWDTLVRYNGSTYPNGYTKEFSPALASLAQGNKSYLDSIGGSTTQSLTSTLPTGSGAGFSIVQPYVAMAYIIKYVRDPVFDSKIELNTNFLSAFNHTANVTSSSISLSGRYTLDLNPYVVSLSGSYLNDFGTQYTFNTLDSRINIDPRGVVTTVTPFALSAGTTTMLRESPLLTVAGTALSGTFGSALSAFNGVWSKVNLSFLSPYGTPKTAIVAVATKDSGNTTPARIILRSRTNPSDENIVAFHRHLGFNTGSTPSMACNTVQVPLSSDKSFQLLLSASGGTNTTLDYLYLQGFTY